MSRVLILYYSSYGHIETMARAVAEGARAVVNRKAIQFLVLVAVLASPTLTAQSAKSTDWRASVSKFAAEHFRHPAWGFSHSVRDYELARDLAREDKVTLDDDVLYAAAYLHDMAAFAPWDREKQGVDHADEAARIVDTVLANTGFPMSKIDAVRSAIQTHMYQRAPVSNEAKYLHDADALDWLGAIGVTRIVALVDENGGRPDGPAAAKMLADNLAAVPSRVLSPAGQRLAKTRAAELKRFLDELKQQSDDLRTL